jgi:hypothetical protein
MGRLREASISTPSIFNSDRVKKDKESVVWCPTGDIIGDFATKPLQGALFCKFRDQIMGVIPAQDTGPGKTDIGVGKSETNNTKPKNGKIICLVPPGKEAAPQECVGSRTRHRG